MFPSQLIYRWGPAVLTPYNERSCPRYDLYNTMDIETQLIDVLSRRELWSIFTIYPVRFMM